MFSVTTDVFGSKDAPAVFEGGRGPSIVCRFAALGAGMLRSTLGTYAVATMISGSLCVVGAFLVLRINRPTYLRCRGCLRMSPSSAVPYPCRRRCLLLRGRAARRVRHCA
jgi:hypothetical protein